MWQKELTTSLTLLAFEPIPHEPCCFKKDGILIFFYVVPELTPITVHGKSLTYLERNIT